MRYVVQRQQFACLVENAPNYLALSDDPLIIFMQICPRLSPTTDEMLAASTNGLPDVTKRTPGVPDAIVILRRPELDCLSSLARDGSELIREETGDNGALLVSFPVMRC